MTKDQRALARARAEEEHAKLQATIARIEAAFDRYLGSSWTPPAPPPDREIIERAKVSLNNVREAPF